MGLLDQIGGMLGGVQGGGQTGQTVGPAAGGQAELVKAVLGMLNHGGGTGLAGLVTAFQQNGLGHIFDSWVSSGHNLPISVDQVRQVLGNDKLAQLAQQTGLSHIDVAGALSKLLPSMIDHASPQGQLPQSGELAGILSGIAGKIFA